MASEAGKRKRPLTEKGLEYQSSLKRSHQSPAQASSFTAINLNRDDSPLTSLPPTPPDSAGGGDPSQSAAYFQAAAAAIEGDDIEDEVVDGGQEDDDVTVHVPPTTPEAREPDDDDYRPEYREPSGCSFSHQPQPSPSPHGASDSDLDDDVDVYNAPRVKYEARYKAFSGGNPVNGSLSTRTQTSQSFKLEDLFMWADRIVNEQLPLPVSFTTISAFVYLQGQKKPEWLPETFKRHDELSWRRFLHLLQRKKRERDAGRGYPKAVCVDFELWLEATINQQPPFTQVRSAVRGSQPSQRTRIQGRASATERQLTQLPADQENLRVFAGNALAVLTRRWRCTLATCFNIHGTCWVKLREGEQMPGRVENHYAAWNPAIRQWLSDIKDEVCTVDDPSDAVRALLRQSRERSANTRATQHIRHQELLSVQQHQSKRLSQLSGTIESLAQLYTARSTAELTRMQSFESKLNPLNSGKQEWEILRAFFQFWWERDRHNDPHCVYIVDVARRVSQVRLSVAEMRDPRVLTTLKWTRDWGWPLIVLDRMRRRMTQFIEHDQWEIYFGMEHGWDTQVFEVEEYLQRIAGQAVQIRH
jgi:hypothetical protein